MSLPTRPKPWAAHLSRVLDATLPGAERFPVKVAALAQGYSEQVFPTDPIRHVQGDQLDGFEGALIPIRTGKKGWGIAYNSTIRSPGRINWTLAHELGHYLVHRHDLPNGIECSSDDVLRGGRDGGMGIEREADEFAAALLMPFDDFRRQLPARDKPDLDILSACADRYGVSLQAATLRWLDYTERRALIVVSREGYALWAKSSDAALKSDAYFATRRTTVELHPATLAVRRDDTVDNRVGLKHPPGVWLPEEVIEMAVFSDRYDVAVSVLLLGDAEPRWRSRDEWRDRA